MNIENDLNDISKVICRLAFKQAVDICNSAIAAGLPTSWVLVRLQKLKEVYDEPGQL